MPETVEPSGSRTPSPTTAPCRLPSVAATLLRVHPGQRPWHYQPSDESSDEYALFVAWEVAGADHQAFESIARAHRMYIADLVELSHTKCWRYRAAEHTRHLNGIRDTAAEKLAETQGELLGRARRAVGRVLRVADREIAHLEEAQERTNRGGWLPAETAIKAVQSTPRSLATLATLDPPTVAPASWDMSRLSIEDLRALRDLERKATAPTGEPPTED